MTSVREPDAPTTVSRLSFGRAQVGFAGFDPKQTANLLAKVDFREGDPGMLRVADAFALPRHACLFDATGARIPETLYTYVGPEGARSPTLVAKLDALAARVAPPQVEPPPGMNVVREPVLFLGRLTMHYGHVLSEFMARMWALMRLDPATRLLFVPAKDPFRGASMGAVLDSLGIERSRLIRIRAPTRFADLICPLPAIRWSERIYAAFDEPHRVMGRRLTGRIPAVRTPVYLSRRGLGTGHRTIHHEEALEAKLAREGFSIVRPETLPLAEQAAIFQGDAPVAGVMGSALHSLLFRDATRPKTIAVLTDTDVHGRFLLFDAVKGAASHYLNCLDTPDTGLTPIQERTLAIDVSRAMAMLDEAGLFRRGRFAAWTRRRRTHAPILLDIRAEAAPAAKVAALDKDNHRERGIAALVRGDLVHLRSPSGARWQAIVDERLEDRCRLYVVRAL